MLNESEQRRYAVQRRRLATLDIAITKLRDEMIPNATVVQAAIWENDLVLMQKERAELWSRFPRADVLALFEPGFQHLRYID